KETSKMAPNLAAGGGIAIIGVIITALVNSAVFDITGGILTTVGVLFAGVSLGLNRRKILNKYSEEITKGRMMLEGEITDKLSDYTHKIKNKIDSNFITFDKHLENEQNAIDEMKSIHKDVHERLALSSVSIKEMLN
ncbi:MAG TPA: GTP-binding protein, partial [Saprospiraceae bacterium]|nr:GTP-binding protein [Saprospiraceae bacterium]